VSSIGGGRKNLSHKSQPMYACYCSPHIEFTGKNAKVQQGEKEEERLREGFSEKMSLGRV